VSAANRIDRNAANTDIAASPITTQSMRFVPHRILREHSENKERWVTLGLAEDNTMLVVVHTLEELAENPAWVRIISARAATGPERKQYQSDR